MARSSQYEQGRRNGIKWAVEWLYKRAEKMNDPHARLVLNCTADLMGNDAKRTALEMRAKGASCSSIEADLKISPAPDDPR